MKALFLDRDGVLNVLRRNDYVKSPDELVLLPGTAEALALLRLHWPCCDCTTAPYWLSPTNRA